MRKSGYIFISFCFILTGCLAGNGSREGNQTAPKQVSEEPSRIEESLAEELLAKETSIEEGTMEKLPETIETKSDNLLEQYAEPIITEADLSEYFDGINGTAVIYDPKENCFQIYNQEAAFTRRPPCSTFKIISSLIALEHGIIDPNDSVRTWSKETFWNEDWNRDIDFFDGFRTSCVWYFRQVIDEIGGDMMQEELNRLQYGNCDISDWQGSLNTNNHNPALTGFWIESSLLISPKEQAEVMERIFGENTGYSEETRKCLEQVMVLPEQKEEGVSIYGKTGMGKAKGVVVDAWFTGFADMEDKRIYFCVHLGETENRDVSSPKAREIAVNMICDYQTEQMPYPPDNQSSDYQQDKAQMRS